MSSAIMEMRVGTPFRPVFVTNRTQNNLGQGILADRTNTEAGHAFAGEKKLKKRVTNITSSENIAPSEEPKPKRKRKVKKAVSTPVAPKAPFDLKKPFMAPNSFTSPFHFMLTVRESTLEKYQVASANLLVVTEQAPAQVPAEQIPSKTNIPNNQQPAPKVSRLARVALRIVNVVKAVIGFSKDTLNAVKTSFVNTTSKAVLFCQNTWIFRKILKAQS